MKRFAFDLGTQSIGWCVLEMREKIPRLLDLGVRTFPDGREPAKNGRMGDPLNAKRRMARQLRKNIERRKRRKAAMYRFLDASGYVAKGDDAQAWQGLDPYKLRAEALSHDMTKLELGRILISLATRRGFKSNRKTDKKDSEAKGQKARQKALEEKLGTMTLGQYLNGLHQDPTSRIRFRSDSEFFPTRAMYEDEFSRIRARQEANHGRLDWDRAYRCIFFQRPLKRPDRAPCTFYPEEPRGYRALPSAQRFRILQDIANLNYSDARGNAQALSIEQKQWLFEKLTRQKAIRFDAMRSEWGVAGSFSLESPTRKELKEDAISIKLRKYFGKIWDDLDLAEQDGIVEKLILEEDDDALRSMLRKMGIPAEKIDLILLFDPPVGTASVSARFMREVSAVMEKEWCMYDEAVKAIGFHHSDMPRQEIREELPYYGEVLRYATVTSKPHDRLSEAERKNPEYIYGRIPNPTVHIALNQLRKLVNALIARHGKPDEIVLEFATELKKGRKALDEILVKQAKNRLENERIDRELQALGGRGDLFKPARNDRRRYILWEELGDNRAGRACVYCGSVIGAGQLMNGEAQIEHIIPFSRSLDDGMANLTVAHQRCNLAKGDRSPYEAFGSNPPGYRWDDIVQRSKTFKSWRKRRRFSPEAGQAKEDGESGFIASQLSDTAYIAKAACDYLSCVCPRNKVRAIPGQLTAEFRSQWGLNTILSTSLGKNRSDHRHHAIDAIVIGLTDRGMLQEAARVNASRWDEKIKAPAFLLDRAEIVERLKGLLVSVKPDHGVGGALLAETAYGYRPKPGKEGDTPTFEYIVRKPVRSLSFAEVDRIIDADIAKRLSLFLASHDIGGKSDKKTWEAALMSFETETGIHRVRIIHKNETGYIQLDKGAGGRRGHKAYQYKDVLCVDIWMVPKGRGKVDYQGAFTYRGEVAPGTEEAPKRRPTSGAKHLMRLYKNDVIRIRRKEGDIFARIAGFSGTNNKLDIQPLYSSDTIGKWLENTAAPFTDPFWKPKEGQNYVSINIIFKKVSKADSVSRIAVSIDGRIRSR